MVDDGLAFMTLELVDLGVFIYGIAIEVSSRDLFNHATVLRPEAMPDTRHDQASIARRKRANTAIDADSHITM